MSLRWDEHNRGRLFKTAQREAHRAGRRAFRAQQATRQQNAAARGAAGSPGQAPTGRSSSPPQAVAKIIGYGKSQRAGIGTAAYITRTRAGDPEEQGLSAEDDAGTSVDPAEIRDAVAAWGWVRDEDNLSPAARQATAGERRAMPEQDRLRQRQTGHLILTVPATAGASREQIHAIARDTLREVFHDRPRRYLFVVHTDHSKRPHAHVLFKTRDDEGKQLRIGPEDLRMLREAFARNAAHHGIALAATAREDRAEMMERVGKGGERLRPRDGYAEWRRNRPTSPEAPAPAAPRPDWLAQKARVFYSRHGAEYELRRVGGGAPRTLIRPAPVALPPLPAATNKALAARFAHYSEPAEARGRFLELAAENRRFALWALNNRPTIFGAEAGPRPPTRTTQREIRLPDPWLAEAMQRLDAVVRGENQAIRAAAAGHASAAGEAAQRLALERDRHHAAAALARAEARLGSSTGRTSTVRPEALPARAEAPPENGGALRRLFDRLTGKGRDRAQQPAAPSATPTAPASRNPTQQEIQKRAKALDSRSKADGRDPAGRDGKKGRSRE